MKTLCAILLSFAATFGCNYIAMPTDFTTVASGTRANLAANFGEVENKFNPCADSVAQVRARLSNYTTSLTVTSLENLRLRVDGDATATGLFLVEGSSGDSLFRVSENLNARLFGHVAIDSNLTVRKVTAADSLLGPSLTLSGLTASRLVATNAGKTAASVSDLTSWVAGTANQITSTSDGDGTLTLSLPSAVTMPGTLSSGAFSATTGSFSSTLGVTSNITTQAAIVLNNASVTNRTIGWQTAGVDRWGLTVGSAAESGSNAGSNMLLRTFSDAGAVIDTPLFIPRAAAGVVEVRRPTAFTVDDNTATAWEVQQGTNEYLKVTTTNSSEAVNIGNTTTNPAINLLGSGTKAISGNATVGGTLGVTGVATFTAAPVFSSANASEFLLLDGSKALTSVAGTGSGSVVRATSPTLVTPTLGVASATSIALGGNESFTYDEGTFTATMTGVSGTVTGTARYVRFGNAVTLYIPLLSGTSNATTFTITGVPAGIRPARTQYVMVDAIQDNTASDYMGFLEIQTGGTIDVWRRTSASGGSTNAYTNTGTKGFWAAQTVTYSLL